MNNLRNANRIPDLRHGVTTQVFVVIDPRKDGYKGKYEKGVSLDYDVAAVHEWPIGSPRPEACLGRATDDPKRYKVFRYRSDLENAGYEAVDGDVLVFGSWKDYQEARLIPPNPEETEQNDWFDYLDRIDVDSRTRRAMKQPPDAPKNKTREGVAAWIAQKHFLVDTGVHEIWYLPKGAPPQEIRLVELNDRFLGLLGEGPATAIDFGLDVKGARFKLFVADVTSEQMNRIKANPSLLPQGWTLDDAKTWRRGA